MPRSVPFALLLPPSEGKAEGGGRPPWSTDGGRFGGALGPSRAAIVEALSAAEGGSPRLLGVGGRHLERARAANASLIGAPTLPAGRRYTGVVWDHLGLATLPIGARRRAAAGPIPSCIAATVGPSARIEGVPRSVPFALLLPPSEGKAEGGGGPRWSTDAGRFGGALGPARTAIVEALAAVEGGSSRLHGVGGRHLERARAANVSLVGAPTLPAGRRYTGVVWDHLGLATLPVGARRRAAASVVVLSGLLGAAGLDDPVPDYRLKMGASLPPLGVLSRWWRPTLSDVLDEFLAGRVVIDLLPNEHRAACDIRGSRTRGHVTVAFVERSGKAAGHDAKAAKGLLARHILVEGGDPRRAIESFGHERFEVRAHDR